MNISDSPTLLEQEIGRCKRFWRMLQWIWILKEKTSLVNVCNPWKLSGETAGATKNGFMFKRREADSVILIDHAIVTPYYESINSMHDSDVGASPKEIPYVILAANILKWIVGKKESRQAAALYASCELMHVDEFMAIVLLFSLRLAIFTRSLEERKRAGKTETLDHNAKRSNTWQ